MKTILLSLVALFVVACSSAPIENKDPGTERAVASTGDSFFCRYQYSYYSDSTQYWVDITPTYARYHHGINGAEDWCQMKLTKTLGSKLTFSKDDSPGIAAPCDMYVKPLVFDKSSRTAKISHRVYGGNSGNFVVREYDLTCTKVK